MSTCQSLFPRAGYAPQCRLMQRIKQVNLINLIHYGIVQGSAKRRASGLVSIASAIAYHFCLPLPAAFTQPGARLLA